MIELDTSAMRKPDLHMFFVECPKCQFDLRFDFYDQVRFCRCGEVVKLSPAYVAHLRQEKEQTLKWLASITEQIGEEST